MMHTSDLEPLWPYLLFLPAEIEKRDEFIRSVLASRLARSVLTSFDETGRALQRNLIENLPHSNKSILAYLKTLGYHGLITTGTTVHHGKRVVYHELTKNGWGLARFFFEGLPSDVEQLTAFLLEDYLIRLATLYRDEGMSESALFDIFARTRAKAILDGSKNYINPDFVLFGASAFYTLLNCETMPDVGGMSSCSSPVRHSGGPTVELALSLASEGFETVLVSSVGNDIDGWNIITNLIQQNVDVHHIMVDEQKQTNQTIIVNDSKGSREFVGVGPLTSLSITSPQQVPWEIIENSKSVYIGEVFVEVASSIAANAKAQNIPVFYRCTVPFWELGFNRLKPILSQVDILLISNQAWRYLKKSHKPDPIKKIQNFTDAKIIIRETTDKYHIIENEQVQQIESNNNTSEITEWFVTGLMQEITKGSNIYEAVQHALKFESKRLAA
ncbi:MAG: carbohydrate kinase family protein [Candidatus Thorarchaeota archaeon]